MQLANGPLPWSWIDPDKALPWVEERIGLALAESQVAAIRLALMSKVLVMTGGPGVGTAEVATIKRQPCCRIGSEQCGSRPARMVYVSDFLVLSLAPSSFDQQPPTVARRRLNRRPKAAMIMRTNAVHPSLQILGRRS
jgi:hypothetical protein